jgi:hypothetical protein
MVRRKKTIEKIKGAVSQCQLAVKQFYPKNSENLVFSRDGVTSVTSSLLLSVLPEG